MWSWTLSGVDAEDKESGEFVFNVSQQKARNQKSSDFPLKADMAHMRVGDLSSEDKAEYMGDNVKEFPSKNNGKANAHKKGRWKKEDDSDLDKYLDDVT